MLIQFPPPSHPIPSFLFYLFLFIYTATDESDVLCTVQWCWCTRRRRKLWVSIQGEDEVHCVLNRVAVPSAYTHKAAGSIMRAEQSSALFLCPLLLDRGYARIERGPGNNSIICSRESNHQPPDDDDDIEDDDDVNLSGKFFSSTAAAAAALCVCVLCLSIGSKTRSIRAHTV